MDQPEPSVPNGSVVTLKNTAGDSVTVSEPQLVANSNYFKWQIGLTEERPMYRSYRMTSEFVTKASLATFKSWLDHGIAGSALDDHRDQGEDRLLNKFLNLVDCFLFGQTILASNFQEFVLQEIRDTCASHNDEGRLFDVIPKVWEHIPIDSGSAVRMLLYETFYRLAGELDPEELADALKYCEEPFRSEVTNYIVGRMNGE